ncbi:MAG: lactate utilization protein [Clostridioides sp.]|jgi:hypothetical protein|nr:lactate utilization protein [Clostridioides sp.]
MKPKQLFNRLLADKLIASFKLRNIEGFYYETREEAMTNILAMIPKESVVGYGGSETLKELNMFETLKSNGYTLLDATAAVSAEHMDDIARRSTTADYYLMSTNAISANGQLVNVDGYGNRVASLIYGPKNVIVVAGMNKVEPNLDAAISRVKTHAAPITALMFKDDYRSYDELLTFAQSICGQMVVTSASMTPGRIKVVLIGEELGF